MMPKRVRINRRSKEIIVIGAGIAGLTAAQKLQGEGHSVTVLESTTRVGGRLKTNRTLGFAFDEGASWIHTPIGNPLTPLAKKAGLKLFLTDDENIKAYSADGKEIGRARFLQGEETYNETIDQLQVFGTRGKSFEEVYRQYYPERANDLLQQFFISSSLTFDTGGTDVLSSVYYDEGEVYKGAEKIVVNGYDTLANYMAQNLRIQFEERVIQIGYQNQGVEVVTEKNRYNADQIILTVPLGVLKKGVIAFKPPLPRYKQEAIQRVGMNQVDKYYCEWERRFWDDTQYIGYTAREKDIFNYYLNLNKINPQIVGLISFAFAKQAIYLEKLGDQAVIAKLMPFLRIIYGASIPQPQHMLRSRWVEDPNTYGAYSFTATETMMEDFDALAKTVAEKVFFAGEHTSREYFSTVHGAYLSGLRAAREMQ